MMNKKKVPKYKSHVIKAIDSAKLSIEMFNRVEQNHSNEASLMFNAQSWELLSKALLIRNKENIYNPDKTTITAEKSINSIYHKFKFITLEECQTIQQVISLRNEATHGILPKIDPEILTHLLYFSLKTFNRVLKQKFKTYSASFDKNYLSISFKEFTFYSHKIQNLFRYSKNFDTKNNNLLYLLERGCSFANQNTINKMQSYDDWEKKIKKMKDVKKIAYKFDIYKYIEKQDNVRFVPVEVKKGFSPEIELKKTKNPLAPVCIKKTDPNIDYPHLTKDIANKLSKDTNFIAKSFAVLKITNNKDYCSPIRTGKNSSVKKYSDKALSYIKDYLEHNPDFNPYK